MKWSVKGSVPLAVLVAVVGLAGCGGSGGSESITVQPAATYEIANFRPSQPVPAGKPVVVSFQIEQPDGTPLTEVQDRARPPHGRAPDLRAARISSTSSTSTRRSAARRSRARHIPRAGALPARRRRVPGLERPAGQRELPALPEPDGRRPVPSAPARQDELRSETVDGYHFTLHGANALKAIQAQLVTVDVTGPDGKPAVFTPWFGALAHAIFFRQGSLDYFHTHVCAPGVSGCTSVLGPTKVTGTSTTPGKLKVGVLVPAPGKWRLFLQGMVDGKVLTAPFVLEVR